MSRVSVITPTWQRHQLLIDRAIPAVQAQTFRDLEHVVISDGPDPALRRLITHQPVTYLECARHDEHPMNFGSRARNAGLHVANGELVAYLDDDNSWRPDHLQLMVEALEANPDADFAYPLMVTHPQGTLIGTDPPQYGGIDTSMIVHRCRLLDLARWPKPSEIDGDRHAPDWAIVERWLRRGAKWVHVPVVTVDYHFAGS